MDCRPFYSGNGNIEGFTSEDGYGWGDGYHWGIDGRGKGNGYEYDRGAGPWYVNENPYFPYQLVQYW